MNSKSSHRKKILFWDLIGNTVSKAASIPFNISRHQSLLHYYHLAKDNPKLREFYDFEINFADISTSQSIHNIEYEHITYLLKVKPAILVLSLYTWNIDKLSILARQAKELINDVIIVAGGPEIYKREDFVLQYPDFDVIIEGDGEPVFEQLLLNLNKGIHTIKKIPNISFKIGGIFHHNPSQPEQSRYMVVSDWIAKEAGAARFNFGDSFYYLSTRGCRFACSYCLWAKQPFRTKQKEIILYELRTLVEQTNVSMIHFFDYDFMHLYHYNKELYQAITQILKTSSRKVLTSFFTNPKYLNDPKLSEIMDNVNAGYVIVGVQSLNPNTLRLVNRAWSIRQQSHLANIPDQIKHRIVVELIFPLPGETFKTFLQGIKRLINYGIFRIQMFPLLMLRGSKIRQDADKFGIHYLSVPPYIAYETPLFSKEDFLVAMALRSFFPSVEVMFSREKYWAIHSKINEPGFLDDLVHDIRQSDNPYATVKEVLSNIETGLSSKRTISHTILSEILSPLGLQIESVTPVDTNGFELKLVTKEHYDLEVFFFTKNTDMQAYKTGKLLKFGYRGKYMDTIDTIWNAVQSQENKVYEFLLFVTRSQTEPTVNGNAQITGQI